MSQQRHRPTVAVIVLLAASSFSSCATESKKATTTSSTTSTIPKFEGSSTSKFCELARQLVSAAGTGDSPSELKAAYEKLETQLSGLIASAPPEIRSDVVRYLDGFKATGDELAKVGYDKTKVPNSAISATQGPDFRNAANRVGAYTTQVCVPASTSTVGGEPAPR